MILGFFRLFDNFVNLYNIRPHPLQTVRLAKVATIDGRITNLLDTERRRPDILSLYLLISVLKNLPCERGAAKIASLWLLLPSSSLYLQQGLMRDIFLSTVRADLQQVCGITISALLPYSITKQVA